MRLSPEETGVFGHGDEISAFTPELPSEAGQQDNTRAEAFIMRQHQDLQRRNAVSNVVQESTHSTCAAAARVDQRLNDLGINVVNSIEDRVSEIEAQLKRDIPDLNRRLRPYEEYKALAEEQNKKLRETQEFLQSRQDAVDYSLMPKRQKREDRMEDVAQKLERLQDQFDRRKLSREERSYHEGLIASLSTRVSELEDQSASKSSDATSLGLDLLGRLQQGESVHPAVATQIKQLLSVRRESDGSEDEDHLLSTAHAQSRRAKRDIRHHREGVSKHRRSPPKHGRTTRRSVADHINGLAISSERKLRSTQGSGPHYHLPETPSVDDSSATTSPSEQGRLSRPTPRKKEVPETQQMDSDVDMDDQDEESKNRNHDEKPKDRRQDKKSEEDEDRPFIPGERKSGRAPKPRAFPPDQLNWKVAGRFL